MPLDLYDGAAVGVPENAFGLHRDAVGPGGTGDGAGDLDAVEEFEHDVLVEDGKLGCGDDRKLPFDLVAVHVPLVPERTLEMDFCPAADTVKVPYLRAFESGHVEPGVITIF